MPSYATASFVATWIFWGWSAAAFSKIDNRPPERLVSLAKLPLVVVDHPQASELGPELTLVRYDLGMISSEGIRDGHRPHQ